MFGRTQHTILNFRAEYADREDFCSVLQKNWESLYLLAFLLTGRHEDAEACFLQTLDALPQSQAVFKHSLWTWMKRSLFKTAARSVFAADRESEQVADRWHPTREPWVQDVINRVVQLSPLERFVFVSLVLERHSPRECALLLNRSVESVTEARIRALGALHFNQSLPIELEQKDKFLAAAG